MKNNQERENYFTDDSKWHNLAEIPNFIRIQKLENYPLVRIQAYLKNSYMDNKYHTQQVYELEENTMTLCVKNIYNLTLNQAIGVMRETDKQENK